MRSFTIRSCAVLALAAITGPNRFAAAQDNGLGGTPSAPIILFGIGASGSGYLTTVPADTATSKYFATVNENANDDENASLVFFNGSVIEANPSRASGGPFLNLRLLHDGHAPHGLPPPPNADMNYVLTGRFSVSVCSCKSDFYYYGEIIYVNSGSCDKPRDPQSHYPLLRPKSTSIRNIEALFISIVSLQVRN
jgi:hypothetical protein